MNYACKDLLSCRGTQLRYAYDFGAGSQGGYQEPQQSGYQQEQQSSGYAEVQSAPKLSSHGYELFKTGGNIDLPDHIDPELAAAAVSPHDAVIQIDGKSIVAPMEHIDTTKVELACDDYGCALIPDDGNPHNDIVAKRKNSYDEPQPQRGYDEPAPQLRQEHSGPFRPEVNKGNSDPYGSKTRSAPSRDREYRAPAKDIDGDRRVSTNNHLAPSNDYKVQTAQKAPFTEKSRYDNTHGIELPMVGGNTYVKPGTNPEIAAAAYDEDQAVIVHKGDAFLAPISSINPDAVELACNDEGCALIKDDGNPHNDVKTPGAKY